MSVEEPDLVDFVGIEPGSDKVVLTVSDHLDWTDETAHLLALQAKLNRYLAFVESGELVEAFPAAAGRRIVIRVITRVPLSQLGEAFVAHAAPLLKAAGIELRASMLVDGQV